MGNPRAQLYFFLILFAAVLILAFLIFLPYLNILALAATAAVVFHPVYGWLNRLLRGNQPLAAITTILLIFLIVLIPLIIFGTLLFQEAREVYLGLRIGSLRSILTLILEMLEKQLGSLAPQLSLDVDFYLQAALKWAIDHVSSIFTDVAKTLFSFFFGLLGLFYLLKDGEKLIQQLVSISPLPDYDDQRVFERLTNTINSVIRGSLLISLIQGILISIGFTLFGVPTPALWGGGAALMALIPGVGTAIVSAIGVLYLFLTSPLANAIGLLIWSIAGVGLVDNFLGPKLISEKVKIHPFLILIAVLGGLQFFGLTGFILGPLILSLLFALGETYSHLLKMPH